MCVCVYIHTYIYSNAINCSNLYSKISSASHGFMKYQTSIYVPNSCLKKFPYFVTPPNKAEVCILNRWSEAPCACECKEGALEL